VRDHRIDEHVLSFTPLVAVIVLIASIVKRGGL